MFKSTFLEKMSGEEFAFILIAYNGTVTYLNGDRAEGRDSVYSCVAGYAEQAVALPEDYYECCSDSKAEIDRKCAEQNKELDRITSKTLAAIAKLTDEESQLLVALLTGWWMSRDDATGERSAAKHWDDIVLMSEA